jgi:hypothetical protein
LEKCRDNKNLQMQQICRGGNLISFRYRRVIKKNIRPSTDQCRKRRKRKESLGDFGLNHAVVPDYPPINTIIKIYFYSNQNRITVRETRKPSISLLTCNRRLYRFLDNLYKNLSGGLTITIFFV